MGGGRFATRVVTDVSVSKVWESRRFTTLAYNVSKVWESRRFTTLAYNVSKVWESRRFTTLVVTAFISSNPCSSTSSNPSARCGTVVDLQHWWWRPSASARCGRVVDLQHQWTTILSISKVWEVVPDGDGLQRQQGVGESYETAMAWSPVSARCVRLQHWWWCLQRQEES